MTRPAEARPGRPAGGRWALVGGTIIDPTSTSIARGGVLIDGDRIDAIGPEVRADDLGGLPVMDVTGRFVLPGLIDTHTHLAFDGGPRPIERYLTDAVDAGLASRMAAAAAAALRAGVTTLRDLAGPEPELLALRHQIAQGKVDGPRLLTAGFVLTPPDGHCHFIGRPTPSGSLAAGVQATCDAGVDCIKVMVTGGVHTQGSSSADVYYEEDELRQAVEVAHRAGVRITAHAGNTLGIERALLAGFDSIQHGSMLDDRLARWMADHGVPLVPTLGTHAAMARHRDDPRIPPYVAAKAHAGMSDKARAFQAALEHGVAIAAGTDGGVTFVDHGALAGELGLFQEAGMGAMELLASATSIAAREVGLEDRIGRLEPGHDADIVVFDRDPISDARALEAPSLVIREGAIMSARQPGRERVEARR